MIIRRWMRWRPQKKDFLFVVGLMGIALEEGRVFGEPSETMVLVFAAMIGLRFVMKADEVKANGNGEPSKESKKNGPDDPDVSGHIAEDGVIP